MLDKMTKATFEPMTGDPFELSLGESGTLTLTLESVRGTGVPGHGAREQFSLYFRGPRTPALPQRIYALSHAGLGALDIFLVPIRQDETGMTYEAVFT